MAITLEYANQLLSSAPGPSPWYLKGCVPSIDSRWGELTWASRYGASVLRDPEGRARLVLGMYVFAIRLGPRSLLVWYGPRRANGNGASILGRVEFRVIQVDELDVITDVAQATSILKEHDLPLILFSASEKPREPVLCVPAKSTGGSVGMPDELDGITELLFFVHVEGARQWALKPKLRMLDVMPQDWFNDGDFDKGYQWPTRAAREGATHAIVGEGIRIGAFVLDASGRNVAAWLK